MIGLYDACVAIDALRGDTRAIALLDDFEELVASEVTRFELLAGVRPHEEDETEGLMEVTAWIAIDEQVARRAAELARAYRPSHSGIDDADYLVAATALLYDLELLTTNVRHFPMLPGLDAAY